MGSLGFVIFILYGMFSGFRTPRLPFGGDCNWHVSLGLRSVLVLLAGRRSSSYGSVNRPDQIGGHRFNRRTPTARGPARGGGTQRAAAVSSHLGPANSRSAVRGPARVGPGRGPLSRAFGSLRGSPDFSAPQRPEFGLHWWCWPLGRQRPRSGALWGALFRRSLPRAVPLPPRRRQSIASRAAQPFDHSSWRSSGRRGSLARRGVPQVFPGDRP